MLRSLQIWIHSPKSQWCGVGNEEYTIRNDTSTQAYMNKLTQHRPTTFAAMENGCSLCGLVQFQWGSRRHKHVIQLIWTFLGWHKKVASGQGTGYSMDCSLSLALNTFVILEERSFSNILGDYINWIGTILMGLDSSQPVLCNAPKHSHLLMSKCTMWLSFPFHRALCICLLSYQLKFCKP